MISIIITSFKEPKTIRKAIESFLNQKISEKYELIITAPDKETLDIAKRYQNKNRQIKIFQDPGKGKSYAINWLLPKLKGEILIFTDGDVYVSKNSMQEIIKKFKDKNIGCVSGKPIPQNTKKSIFGYWAHLLCNSVHNIREKRANMGEFLECSGYLWAFRNKIIKKFPLDVGEDTIVPLMFWIKNYKISYSPESKVYVKFPSNLNDFLQQKTRAAAAHDNIHKYFNLKKIPRMKTFTNEILLSYKIFAYANSLKELVWIFLLFPIRLYIWANLFYNSKFRNRKYTDAWKIVKSTK